MKKNGAKIVTGVMAVYFIFFMTLGTRTFAQHVIRIATTPESKDLAYEAFGTAREVAEALSARARGMVSGFSKRSSSNSNYSTNN
ncbi:MAG: hypothetical protein RL701_1307 [Pseudomonadota bacterium]|jgi:hypothetical protein